MTRRVANLNSTPSSLHFGVVGSDLFIPILHRNGWEIMWLCGDTFGGERLTGKWDSPIILVSSVEKPYEFHRCIGTATVEQVLRYKHRENGVSTILPTSWIYVGSRLFMHYMVMGNGGLSDTVGTGMCYSDDDGLHWTDRGLMWTGKAYDGVNNMNVFFRNEADSTDGHVYCLRSSGLARNANIVMFRVPADKILDPNAYQPWGLTLSGGWTWLRAGQNPWPIMPNDVRSGEIGAAWIEKKLVVSYFRGDSIEVKVGDAGVMTNWHTCPTYRPVKNTAWGLEREDSAAQLYGGYPVPGSTLRNLRLSCSQWKTDDNTVYRGMVFDQIDVSRPPVQTLAQIVAARVRDALARLGRR